MPSQTLSNSYFEKLPLANPTPHSIFFTCYVIQFGLSLLSAWSCCPSCIPSQHLAYLQTTGGRVRKCVGQNLRWIFLNQYALKEIRNESAVSDSGT